MLTTILLTIAMLVAPQGAKTESEWTGTLRTGVIAIGGETTGIVLDTGKEKFELKAATDAVAEEFKKLDKQKVTVRGTLARQPGIEIKERTIITVTKVTKAG